MQAAPAAVQTFEQALKRMGPSLQKALPRHIDVERFMRIALSCVNRDPKLLACSQMSLVRAIMQAAQLGLEVASPLGEAYLVPFKGEVVLIIGYGGLVELATRTGRVTSVEARAVHERDLFAFRHGTDQSLEHVPYLGDEDAGNTVAVYAIARMKEGEPKFEVMSVADVQRIRAMSKQADGDAWTNNWDSMAAKTVVRRVAKLLPKSAEMARAIALDAKADAGESQDDDETRLDFGTVVQPAADASQRTGAAARVAGKVGAAGNGRRTEVVVKEPDGTETSIPPAAESVAAEGGGGAPEDAPPHSEASPAPPADAVPPPPPPPPLDRDAVIARCRAIITERAFGEQPTIKAVAPSVAAGTMLEQADDATLRGVARTLARYDASGELLALVTTK